MYVDADAIIKAAALLGAVSALAAFLYKLFKWIDNQQDQDKKLEELKEQHEEDIKTINGELCLIVYGLFATLDGLKQQGANGNVTDAYNLLEKHVNKAAHGKE